MITALFPRAHARYLSLPLLGPHLDGFAQWLAERGHSRATIRSRIRRAPQLVEELQGRGLADPGEASRAQLLALTAGRSQENQHLSALVRSLAAFLAERGILAAPAATPSERLAAACREHLARERGLADSTQVAHDHCVRALLAFLRYDADPSALSALGTVRIDAFLRHLATGPGRSRIRHEASFLRSFLRFLAGRGEIAAGLDACVDTARAPRPRALPRALPWQAVQSFLAGIDTRTPAGLRDRAMFTLMATCGLRASEVACLRLDDISWRAARFRVQRPKVLAPIDLPLTEECGPALIDYLRQARPKARFREVFLRLRRPVGPLSGRSVVSAFRSRRRGSALDRPGAGTHCLRHSLAMHLLSRDTPVKTIGELLGHRSLASTGTYLRVHAEHLRAAALELPDDGEEER